MRVQLDYSQGRVLGHRRRCEILQSELENRGHDIVDGNPDWLVVDYPRETFPEPVSGVRRLVMGVEPQTNDDWAWHPLGESGPRRLFGPQYLILDPRLAEVRGLPKERPLLITLGAADPLRITRQVCALLSDIEATVVFGPRCEWFRLPERHTAAVAPEYDDMLELLATHRVVVCGWGNTAFEAMYLNARVFPVATRVEHFDEARRLGRGVFYLAGGVDERFWIEGIRAAVDSPPEHSFACLDLNGARRVVEFMTWILSEGGNV